MQIFESRFARSAAALLLALPLAVGCHGPGHGMANLNEAEIAERMEDVAEIGLDSVDADDQQVARVNQVLRGLAPELVALRAEHRALGAELRKELAKDTIDRARVEELRKRALALFDKTSAKGSEALLAAADVLTPAQRNELTYKWEKFSH
jgi:Spy/CpxP family protein refolding chaperone